MIRWGVLGAASIARRRIIPAIQASSNGRVTAIASRDPARARELAAQLDLPVVHADYASLLADPAIDAIYLPLPNSEHHEWTIAAVRAGKHVLCEKPFAMNAAEAEAMAGAAAESGVLLAEAFMYRFHPRIARLRDLIQAGAIGDIRLIRFTFTFGGLAPGNIRLDPALGGGALMDLGCYGVNLARLICGDEPETATALASHGSGGGVDQIFTALLRFPGDRFAVLETSLVSQFAAHFEIIGSDGKIAVPQGVRPETNQPTELHLERGMEPEVIAVEPADHYRLMVEDFADAILSSRPVRFGPDDAIANMRVLDTLRTAAQTMQR